MAGATRPVGGGAYSGPRAEPGGQTSPRAGRSVASLGSYIASHGSFLQHIDQGDIFDEAADGLVIASGASVEDYSADESGTATITASGTRAESRVYDDTGTIVSPAPTAVTVVDDFNRANGDVLAGTGAVIWSPTALASTLPPSLTVAANQLAMIGAAQSVLTLADYSGDFDVILDVPTVPVSGSFRVLAMHTRATTPAAAIGYGLLVNSSAPWATQRNDGAGFASVNDIGLTRPTVALQNGDKIAFSRRGDRLSGFLGRSGAWTLMTISNADTTYPSGALGIQAVTTSGSWSVDNFIGGAPNNVLVVINGTSIESSVYNDSASAPVTASGMGVEANVVGSYGQTILADSPAAYWRLADLTDSSGHGFTLTPSGTVANTASLLATDPGNGSKEFKTDTNVDRLSVADDPLLRLSNAFAVEAWAVVDFMPEDFTVLSKASHYRIATTPGGKFRATVFSSGGFWEVSSTTNVVVGQVYHLVLTFDGSVERFYVNGTLEASLTITGSPLTNATAFAIGRDTATGNLGWWGRVDEPAIYNSVLSPATVQAHYIAGAGTVYNDSASTTVTASGAGTESIVYDDTGSGTITANGNGVENYVTTQILLPDADIAVAGWVVAPLYPKLSDDSDATVVTGVLV